QMSPQAAMTAWLTGSADDWPAHFAPGQEVELKSADEMKSVVKFTRHHLDDEQMRLHIGQGKLPTKLALDWDGRVRFVLTESTVLGKIAFLDGVYEDNASAEDEGGFDADVAIATGELGALINDLTEALGGELL
ncbi:MAG: recombination-associated protein RdgC, partial [Burkholderiaceae bacterium]|nr:recombination-associated protein RdgC [Burkholderiaceae bacterium]